MKVVKSKDYRHTEGVALTSTETSVARKQVFEKLMNSQMLTRRSLRGGCAGNELLFQGRQKKLKWL
ncbi:MAG: hypothetical protein CVU05_15785 [Bacteroidetes bacterium HGW-Bacteroidetes-21]|nr:MAG: hypothetical protein CVU05_15785 [Bacteroidetes bacterium HGW-Bacteroidetes-21]